VFEIAGHGFSNGDWVYLASMGGMPQLSGRFGIVANKTTDTFELTDLRGNAISTAALAAYTGGGTAARVYEVATPYTESDVFDLHYVQSADVLTLTHPSHAPRELRRLGATNWQLDLITFDPTIAAPSAAPTVSTAGAGGGSPENHTYVTTAIKEGTLEESYPSLGAGVPFDLTIAGNRVLVDTVTVSGAVRYNVYEYTGGIYSFVGQTDGAQFVDNNITPDTSKTPPIPNNPFTGSGTWPRAVSYHEQRRCFGGSINLPQTIWMTRSGTEANLSYSIPAQDDDSITARIVAREAQVVRHLVPLGDLLAFTSGGVWRISAGNADYLSPSSFRPQAFSYTGASNVQPMVTSQSVLYAPDRGAHIREVTYKATPDGGGAGFGVDDVCVLAPHLFDYQSVVQLAYAKSPLQILWAVRGDGLLLGMTHVPEHEVKAWHRHDTQGSFEAVCSVAEGDEDGVYVVVQREVDETTVRYIERMHSRQFEGIEDCFFVDSGLTYSGPATDTIRGLDHLEGCDVVALAAGGVESGTVENGALTLASEATPVHVGLGYVCDLQTLPLALETAGLGQGVPKNVSEVFVRVRQSKGVMVGPSFDKLRPYRQRTTEPYGTPTRLVSEVLAVKPDGQWQEDGAVCVRQSDPLPLEVSSMTLETSSGG
jgi:hypothetical protein